MKTNEEFFALVNEKAKKETKSLSRKKKIAKRATATALSFAIILTAVFTAVRFSDNDNIAFDGIRVEALSVSQNLTENLSNDNKPKAEVKDLDDEITSATDFAFDLLRAAYDGDNILISPYSVYTALAMTANGANGKTREEIEDTLGLTVDEMNLFLSSHSAGLYNEWPVKIQTSNSLWFKNNLNNFRIKNSFLSDIKNYYDADAFSAPFDQSTVNDINNWVNDATRGMIPELLDTIPDAAIMYLINTVFIEARWDQMYKEQNIKNDVFNNKNGDTIMVDYLSGYEEPLISLENALGFSKYFAKGGLRFMAFLPNEGVTTEELLASLNAEDFRRAIHEHDDEYYYPCALPSYPAFTDEFGTNIVDALKKLGIKRAFSSFSADFSNLGDTDGESLYVSSILHKTKIIVNDWGTKAAAVSSVQTDAGSMPSEDEPIILNFNRPFLYMIVDNNDIPIFIGTLENFGEDNFTEIASEF